MTDFDWLHDRLGEMEAADLVRRPMEIESAQGPRLTVRDTAGRRSELVNFCSNNYLNLAGDPRIVSAAESAVRRWGVGSGASRLICGTSSPHRQAERAIAGFLGVDDAVLLSTGYMANLAAVATLAGPGDSVILDKLDHASLIDAARLSGARMRVYPHGRVDRLESLLSAEAVRGGRLFVLTDSLFSMDGDFAPLADIAALKSRFKFTLIVDEAHAIGVIGAAGRGVAELLGVGGAADVIVGTCSKALGGAGGFVAGRRVLIDAMRNMARPFIYSTAPPAAVAAVAVAAVRIVQAEPERRLRVAGLADGLRRRLRDDGWDIGPSCSHIVPVMLGSPGRALAAQRALTDRGLLAVAIRPPTVPANQCRLRVSLMDGHSQGDMDRLAEALAEARARSEIDVP